MNDADIWTCRSAIKRIAWLESKAERQAALNELPPRLRGAVERGVKLIFPVVQRKRTEKR